MHPKHIAVIFERLAELIENKMAVSKALKQVGKELKAFDTYCKESRHEPVTITTKMLKNCKI